MTDFKDIRSNYFTVGCYEGYLTYHQQPKGTSHVTVDLRLKSDDNPNVEMVRGIYSVRGKTKAELIDGAVRQIHNGWLDDLKNVATKRTGRELRGTK